MNCQFCTHPESAHCPGGVAHLSRKNDGGSAETHTTVCVSRHCTNPLCCCVRFVPERVA